MPLAPLPNAWNLYNLKHSPYFQGALEGDGDEAVRPLILFVGRRQELRTLAEEIRGAGNNATRHAIAGAPGVGKTTLVQELKSQLRHDGYFSTANHVQILPDDSAASLLGRIIASII